MQNNFDETNTIPSIIANEIARKIKLSIYKPKEKLPSRKELAWKYDVHENTIKKVFGILRKQKLIKYRPHFGMMVQPIPKGIIKFAIIMPLSYFGFNDFIEGIKEVCDPLRASFDILAYKNSAEQMDFIKSLQYGTYDGAVVYAKFSDEVASNISALTQKGMPIVLLGIPVQPELSCWRVDGNYYRAAYMATERLLEYQHRKIGIVISKSHDSVPFEKGYKRAMMEYGRRVRKGFIQYVDDDRKPGDSTVRFISEGGYSPAKAIIYSKPEYALPGIKAIKESHIKIGRDISVICFGDFPDSEKHEPPISVVRYNHMDVGTQAGELLFQWMREPDNPACESSNASIELVFRETSIKTVKEQICLSELQKQRWAERYGISDEQLKEIRRYLSFEEEKIWWRKQAIRHDRTINPRDYF